MNVLMTGGTGYVGTALRRRLIDAGHRVRLLVRAQSVGRIEDPQNYDILRGDVLDTPTCLRAVDGCEAVVHLVGIIREYRDRGVTFEALHTEATRNILGATRRSGLERFVLMSALGASPDSPARYHRTKFAAEAAVCRSGLRWTIFRPSIIFHPGDEFSLQVADMVHRAVVPMIDGGGTQLQPVSLENVTAAITACLRMPESQGRVYELGGPDRLSIREIVDAFAARYKVWTNQVGVSSRLMLPAARLLERFAWFPVSADQIRMLRVDNVCDPEPFCRAFGVERLDSYRDALPALIDAARPGSVFVSPSSTTV